MTQRFCFCGFFFFYHFLVVVLWAGKKKKDCSQRGQINNMTIPIPDRRASDNEMEREVSLTNGFGSFFPAESPWRRVVRSCDFSANALIEGGCAFAMAR